MSNAKKPGTGVTNRRRRELAAAKLERQAARRAARAVARRRRMRIVAGLAAVVAVVAVVALAAWPSGDGEPVASGTPTATASPVAVEGCGTAPTPSGTPATREKAPGGTVTKGGAYELVLTTNCGDIVIQTKPVQAPKTVDSMLTLAGQGYFDDSLCHRVTTEGLFVLQCGDPTGTGSWDPGFTLPDENLPKAGTANYPRGTVAMANAGPGTSGTQFFIVYEDTTLPASYTIWGSVTSGLDIVRKIAEAGVSDGGTDGPPAAPIGIVGAEVKASTD